MKLGKQLFDNDFLFHFISQWKRRRLMLFQVHCELTLSYYMK